MFLLRKMLSVVFPVPWLLCFLLSVCSHAEEADRTKLEPVTQKVIVFKDGFCLVIKKGVAVTDKEGAIYMDEIPDAAVLGTFWAVPNEGRLIGMNAGWNESSEQIEKEVPCTQNIEILQANKGKSCKIFLHDKTEYAGVIRDVLVHKTITTLSPGLRNTVGLPLQMGAGFPAVSHRSARPIHSGSATISGITGSSFVLKTDDDDVLLPVGQIRTLSIQNMKTTLKRTITTKSKKKRLTFKFAEPGMRREITLMYFRPGLRWIPAYRIHLNPDEKKQTADMALQAEILNEAEDLIDVPVDIVVGVPNFRFRTTVSPMILETTLRRTLQQAAPQVMGQLRNDLSNVQYTQRSSEFRRGASQASGVAGGGTVNLPNELTASGKQDLFVYSLPKLKLLKGERMAVSIFSAAVPYRSIYTWDLHLKHAGNDTAPSGSGVQSPLVLSKNEVWHQILLTNTTNVPWTTGAAMIMQGNQPLAQDLLTYTSPKDEVRVPVTVSVATRGSLTQQETGRQLKAIHWSGSHYAKIEKEPSPDLCNNKSVPIEAEITMRLGGKVTDASHEGKITLGPHNSIDWKYFRGDRVVNNSSTVRWKVSLKPGETFKPKVKYHYYVRH